MVEAHADGVCIMAAGASDTEQLSPIMDAVPEGAMDIGCMLEAALGLKEVTGAVVGRSNGAAPGWDFMSRAPHMAAIAADDTSVGCVDLAGSRGGLPACPFFFGSGCKRIALFGL